jgi:hypothetical protein
VQTLFLNCFSSDSQSAPRYLISTWAYFSLLNFSSTKYAPCCASSKATVNIRLICGFSEFTKPVYESEPTISFTILNSMIWTGLNCFLKANWIWFWNFWSTFSSSNSINSAKVNTGTLLCFSFLKLGVSYSWK